MQLGPLCAPRVRTGPMAPPPAIGWRTREALRTALAAWRLRLGRDRPPPRFRPLPPSGLAAWTDADGSAGSVIAVVLPIVQRMVAAAGAPLSIRRAAPGRPAPAPDRGDRDQAHAGAGTRPAPPARARAAAGPASASADGHLVSRRRLQRPPAQPGRPLPTPPRPPTRGRPAVTATCARARGRPPTRQARAAAVRGTRGRDGRGIRSRAGRGAGRASTLCLRRGSRSACRRVPLDRRPARRLLGRPSLCLGCCQGRRSLGRQALLQHGPLDAGQRPRWGRLLELGGRPPAARRGGLLAATRSNRDRASARGRPPGRAAAGRAPPPSAPRATAPPSGRDGHAGRRRSGTRMTAGERASRIELDPSPRRAAGAGPRPQPKRPEPRPQAGRAVATQRHARDGAARQHVAPSAAHPAHAGAWRPRRPARTESTTSDQVERQQHQHAGRDQDAPSRAQPTTKTPAAIATAAVSSRTAARASSRAARPRQRDGGDGYDCCRRASVRPSPSLGTQGSAR